MWSLYVPILSKVDQEINWVKLKSVRTFLRITCLADKKSYMVISCASSCEKLKGHPRSKVTRSTKIPYMTYYVFHINFCHNMHHSENTAHYKLTYLDLTFKGHPRSKVMRSTKRPNMTYYMCFI